MARGKRRGRKGGRVKGGMEGRNNIQLSSTTNIHPSPLC